jgi:DHA1 family bicyclomycin/chloramphenicol resistance-like MFS transporter
MTKRPIGSAEFIALSACTMTLTALGIDIMLPVFGEMRSYFGLGHNSTATTDVISFFFMGQVAQFIFGILSDRYGRLPILRVGFPLYIVGGVAAAFAPSLPLIYAARFIAGMGASALFTTTIAGVRDRFAGDAMAHTMSLIFTIFLLTPVVAPFLGSLILAVSSWRMVFLTPPIIAVVVFAWSVLRLPESLPREKRIPINWGNLRRSIRRILSNGAFVRYTFVTVFLFSALSAYVASSERICGETYGHPELFKWIFGGTGLLMVFCSFGNSYLAKHFGARRSIKGLLIAYLVVAAALLFFTLFAGDPPAMAIFFGAIALILSLNLAIEPNSSALAMEPMGDLAGLAASVYGTFFFFIGSNAGSVVSHLMTHGVLPLVISIFIVGVLCLLMVFSDRRPLGPSRR